MALNVFQGLVNGVRSWVVAIATSAGTADAGKLISTDGAGRLNATFLPVGVSIEALSRPTTEALAAGDLVNLYSAAGVPSCRKADASTARAANGFVLDAVASGATAIVYQEGANTAAGTLAVGAIGYLSNALAGKATTTPIANYVAGQIFQEIGYASDTGTLFFKYSEPTVFV